MELLLWRHAEAEAGTPDLKRPLTPKGERQAAQVADWIRRHAPKHLRILVSPATRCQQTAQALDLPFDTDKRLGPDSDVAHLLTAAGWPLGDGSAKDKRAVLVVGHQPVLGRTASLLLAGVEADWTIKKGGLWWFSQRTRLGDARVLLKSVVTPER